MRFKIPYIAIKKAINLFVKFAKFILNGTLTLLIILLSLPIWLPIITWKMGLIFSDHIIKYFIND